MRRLVRYPLNAFTLLSLLLCASAIFFWIRSHYVADRIGRQFRENGGGAVVRSECGTVLFSIAVVSELYRLPEPREPVLEIEHHNPDKDRPERIFRLLERMKWEVRRIPPGITWAWRPDLGEGFHVITQIPHWLIATLGTLLPVGRMICRRRHSMKVPGCCTICGYDLRATPNAGAALLVLCPECGTISPALSSP